MGTLKIGAKRKEITPPVGIDLSGYIRRFGSSKGIHDHLLANFLWIENERNHVLLISMDIFLLERDFSLKAKEAISLATKIPKKNILIACTHTHSAPGIHNFRNGGKRDGHWEEKILHLLTKGAYESKQNIKKASLGTETGLAMIGKNRRKNRGPVDPSFPIICFIDEKEQPLAIIANYGCHPVVLDEKNLLISSDYVGSFRDYLNRFLSADPVTLFLTGACGDVDPMDRGNFKLADKFGEKLADEALRTIKKMEFKSDIEIMVKEIHFQIPYGWIPSPQEARIIHEKSLAQYEEALKKGDKEKTKIHRAFLLWAEELKEKADKNELPSHFKCELQCITLADAALLAFPFELFASVSLSLRKENQTDNLFIVGYANGYGGYLPDESSFSEGGYEVDEAFKFSGLLPLSFQADKLFKEKALSLIKK